MQKRPTPYLVFNNMKGPPYLSHNSGGWVYKRSEVDEYIEELESRINALQYNRGYQCGFESGRQYEKLYGTHHTTKEGCRKSDYQDEYLEGKASGYRSGYSDGRRVGHQEGYDEASKNKVDPHYKHDYERLCDDYHTVKEDKKKLEHYITELNVKINRTQAKLDRDQKLIEDALKATPHSSLMSLRNAALRTDQAEKDLIERKNIDFRIRKNVLNTLNHEFGYSFSREYILNVGWDVLIRNILTKCDQVTTKDNKTNIQHQKERLTDRVLFAALDYQDAFDNHRHLTREINILCKSAREYRQRIYNQCSPVAEDKSLCQDSCGLEDLKESLKFISISASSFRSRDLYRLEINFANEKDLNTVHSKLNYLRGVI